HTVAPTLRSGRENAQACASITVALRDHLAARFLALVGAAHVDDPLALALVLALAGVLRSLAASLALAGIDAGALDPSAGLVRGTRDDIAGQYESRCRARDEHPSPDHVRSAVHSRFLPLSGCGVTSRPSSARFAAPDFVYSA